MLALKLNVRVLNARVQLWNLGDCGRMPKRNGAERHGGDCFVEQTQVEDTMLLQGGLALKEFRKFRSQEAL